MGKVKSIGTIRAPQIVGMYGPGAIINLEKISVMPTGVNAWNPATPTIASPTFMREIGADRLINCSSLSSVGIPATLFPRTFVCSLCGTIQEKTTITESDLKFGFSCYADKGPLYPSRWIVYCEDGHIEDFNYRSFLKHQSVNCLGRLCLTTGASLSETYVECECGGRASMQEAYRRKDSRLKCSGKELWTSQSSDCDATVKVSMRSASDVYFGAVRSAITIEPESDPLVARAFEVVAAMKVAAQNERDKVKMALEMSRYFETVAEEDVDRVLDLIFKAKLQPAEYRNRRYQEYGALARSSGSPKDDLYVEAIRSDDLEQFGINGLYAVRKLREVRALVGFMRGGMPPDPAFDEISNAPQRLASLGREGVFPAYENRGEGVFITLDPGRLKDWIARTEVARRVDAFANAEEKWRASSMTGVVAKKRGFYILAHSLAHLLIRQISLVSGYSQSSLRERVYASQDDDATPWAGVLIYTASSDADGSLGGLVAQATDRHLGEILEDAFLALHVCSSDPICALQVPVGFRKMNAAACHGCLVLPETCCERNNYVSRSERRRSPYDTRRFLRPLFCG